MISSFAALLASDIPISLAGQVGEKGVRRVVSSCFVSELNEYEDFDRKGTITLPQLDLFRSCLTQKMRIFELSSGNAGAYPDSPSALI